jgi:cation diffusion facilitator family transporter
MGHDTFIDNTPKIRRVLIYTLILNLGVAFAKMAYGYISNSVAMISDGFHSSFDGVSNIFGLVGICMASRPPDKDHPYGHRKYETLFTIIIGIMVLAACFQILKLSYHSLVESHKTEVTAISFIVMLITMGVNIYVAVYEFRKGKQLKSDFLVADSMHTRSDILTSIGVIVSLIITKLGFPFADTIVGLIIAFLIARIGWNILKEASDVLVDTTRIDNEALTAIINGVSGVKGCHDIRTRGTQHLVYLDLHILVDPKMSTEEAHAVSDSVEENIKAHYPSISDIVVHIEPDNEKCK